MAVVKALVLLSGGVDSTTLLHFVKQREHVVEIHALTFLYGQKHLREVDMARWQARNAAVAVHKELDISALGGVTGGKSALTGRDVEVPDLEDISEDERQQPRTYVPNRNMVFLSLAAAYAETEGIVDIYYGAQQQDEYGYWDCTRDFVDRINEVLSLNRDKPVKVRAPFVDMKKTDVVKIGLELGVDYSHTWTCYRGGAVPCGRCPSCVERQAAMVEAGRRDDSVVAN